MTKNKYNYVFLLLSFWAFSSLANENQPPAGKMQIQSNASKICETLTKKASSLGKLDQISRATSYYIPLFKDLSGSNKRNCLNMEGSCVTTEDGMLRNYGKPPVKRESTNCQFGFGSGEEENNKTNCLDPCHTLAADKSVYPAGTVIVMASMVGKICPQTGKPIDNPCFVVGDVGSAIKGHGRFDFFVGECIDYNDSTNSCNDQHVSDFTPRTGQGFYAIHPGNGEAQTFRRERDQLIQSRWKQSDSQGDGPSALQAN